MSEREQFEERFPITFGVRYNPTYNWYEETDKVFPPETGAAARFSHLWEGWQAARKQQAKELAGRQARVVVLSDVAEQARSWMTMPKGVEGERNSIASVGRRQKQIIAALTEALASTDTAAIGQSVREKYYEECAVIANSCEFGVTKNFVAEQIRKAKENI